MDTLAHSALPMKGQFFSNSVSQKPLLDNGINSLKAASSSPWIWLKVAAVFRVNLEQITPT